MDAFRWVFGEQNVKELRGSGMDDIIFSGSDSRKPSGFAEVSLTLSEIDESITSKWGTFSEITVGRKYYRSGEREYLINNRKCKLKDIREIFFDTGIGARSISIIEQGKVEKIINATPEELRLFFEETAGVVKYKEKKKESEKRLKQTFENLNRVNDIISEITQNIQTLESQVSKLEEYKKLNNEKIKSEKEYFSNLYNNYESQLISLQNKINEEKIKLTDTISLFEQERDKETALKEENEQLTNNLKLINEDILKNIKKINSYNTEIKLLENNILSADKSKENLTNEITTQTEKLKTLTSNIELLNNKKEQIDKELNNLNEIIDDLNEVIESLNSQKEIVEEDISDIDDIFLETTHRLSSVRNEIFSNENNISRLEKEYERIKKEKVNIDIEIKETEKQIEVLENTIANYRKEMLSLEDKLSVSDKEEIDLKYNIDKLNSEINNNKIEIQICEKNIELNKEQLNSISFGDEENQKIFNSLKAKLIVDFIPLEDILAREIGDIIVFDIKNKDSVFKNIKNIKGNYRFIFNNQIDEFEKYLFSCSIDKINDYIYKFENIYKISTDENNAHKILILKKEIDALVSKINSLNSEIKSLETSVEKESEKYNNILKYNAQIKDELQKLEINYQTSKNQLESSKNNLDVLKSRVSIIEKEEKIITQEKNNFENILDRLKLELKELADKQAKIDEEKEDLEGKRTFLVTKIEDEKEQLSENKINQRGLKEQQQALKKEIYYIDKEISTTSKTISNHKQRLEQLLHVDLTNWKNSLEEKKNLYSETNKEQIMLQDKKKYIENQISNTLAEISALSKKIDSISNNIRDIENKINDIELKKVKISSEKESIELSYVEKFNTNIEDDYRNYIIEDFKQNKLRNLIYELNKKIEDLGPLNMAAEQEYNESKQRYEFLVKQRQDLEEAVIKINELINEIDDNSATQFKQTFDDVSKNFIEVFQILFGDGKAKLTLTDPDNLLTTGVDIFVQPPGKKLQNMNLLSGGEKAMTACTLLFAMFLHKPTPFCFLDEIDAPLDDANISRFIKIVKKLSKDSQFVIITHNQKTMSEADSIYGVTMQEPGVSKLLSVRLDNV
jgi:chromosome segregation protein